MRLAVLFSGGKDSVYACYRAMQTDRVCALITLVSKNPDSFMFHTPNIRKTEAQAEAMLLPLLTWQTEGLEESELSDLRGAISEAVEVYGIEGIVTGAIESVYQATRVQRICRELVLWCFSPLWQTDQLEYLRRLLREGFSVMISGVYAYPFDSSWLGAALTEERINSLAALQKRYRINPSGEGGELESYVLDAPIFHKRIEILRSRSLYANYRGHFLIDELRLVDKPEAVDGALDGPVSPAKETLAQGPEACKTIESGPSVAGLAEARAMRDDASAQRHPGDMRHPDNNSNSCKNRDLGDGYHPTVFPARGERESSEILLIDLSWSPDSLSIYEFVHPVRDALHVLGHRVRIIHRSRLTPEALTGSKGVILCGTALQDNDYVESLDSFKWITDYNGPVLGICAGMQVIGAVFGGSIVSDPKIGLCEIEILEESPLLGEPRRMDCYHLHDHSVTLPNDFRLLAGRADAAWAFSHSTKPIYGVAFHPEVRCRYIFDNFADLLHDDSTVI